MSRRVVLHIGAPKTGTTYLQGRLSANLRSLRQHGVHLPHRYPLVTPELFQFRAALDLVGEDWGGKHGHAAGSWEQLVGKVRRAGEGTVVVSHEILAPAPGEAVARAKHDLLGRGRATELHVVYTARDLGRQIPAAWQESVKQGNRRNYARFITSYLRGRQWWARAFDLPTVLASWGQDLPPEHVHVVTVPHRSPDVGPDVLWDRFASAAGIDPKAAPAPAATQNPSLGMAETQLIRRLNRNLDPEARREADFDKLVRQVLAQDSLVDRRRSKAVRLPPALHPFAVEQADRWAEWVSASGVDLVGDLAELQPGPAVENWVDPDKGRPREQLTVAVAALSTMTEEAARREDPDAKLLAKARVQRRRMRGQG